MKFLLVVSRISCDALITKTLCWLTSPVITKLTQVTPRSTVIALVVRTWQESDWPIHGPMAQDENRTDVRTSGLNSHRIESYRAWGTQEVRWTSERATVNSKLQESVWRHEKARRDDAWRPQVSVGWRLQEGLFSVVKCCTSTECRCRRAVKGQPTQLRRNQQNVYHKRTWYAHRGSPRLN